MALPDVAKRQAFVRHYVVSGNATRAAIAVGCSPKLASVTASRWLRNGDVLALLRKQIDLYLRDLVPGALNALRQLVESNRDTPCDASGCSEGHSGSGGVCATKATRVVGPGGRAVS